jgi:hypothetical protein
MYFKNSYFTTFLVLVFLAMSCSPNDKRLAELAGVKEDYNTRHLPSELGNQAFTFSPTSHNFGYRAQGSAPVTATVTLKNSFTRDIYLTSIGGLSGVFNLVSDTCPRTPIAISPKQTCTVTISFAPVSGISYNASLITTYGESAIASTSYTAHMGTSGIGVGELEFDGIESVTNIYSSQLMLNWDHVLGATSYYVFRVNPDESQTFIGNVNAPAETFIVSGLTANTSYRFWVRALDVLGTLDTNSNIVTTATNSNPAAPVTIGFTNYIFPSNAIRVGDTFNLDFDDNRTGTATDDNVTYNCSYDQTIDGSVATTNNCSVLGTFDTMTGEFEWSPHKLQIGFYEFKIITTDTNSSLTDTDIFIINVSPAYKTTNLIGNYSAMFGNGSSSNTIETTWQDLTTNNFDGFLYNFNFNAASGWQGNGTLASPYRLVFDGNDDYIDLANMGNAASSLAYETWIKHLNLTSPQGSIITNADDNQKGLMLREAKGYRNRVEAVIGSKSYADIILEDNPVVYLRMGDQAGQGVYDIGSAGSTWSATSISEYEEAGVLGGNDKSFKFNGSSSRIQSVQELNPATWSGVTYEGWFKFANPVSDDTAVIENLFSQSAQSLTNGYFWMYYRGNGTLVIQTTNGVIYNQHAKAWVPTAGQWYHLTATVDFVIKEVKLYVDGVNIHTVSGLSDIFHTSLIQPRITVGSYHNPAHYLNGHIDEVAVYDYALPSARVTAHYNARDNYYSCLSNLIDANTWNHLATSFDHSTQTLQLFTNSNLDCSINTFGINLQNSSNSMFVGEDLNAEMTDIRVYDEAFSSAEVRFNMDSLLEQFDIPKTVPGLNLWLKADAIEGLEDGDPVETWNDLSSLSRIATQATPSQRPLYIANGVNGKPVVRFDGVDDQMNISEISKSWTLFVVARQNALKSGMMHILSSNSSGFMYYITSIPSNTTNVQWYVAPPNWAAYHTIESTLGLTNFYIHTYRGTATLAEAWVNGIKGLSNTGDFTEGHMSCLGAIGCSTRHFVGDIAEVIAYSGTLTEAQRMRIEGYLRAKYNLNN